MNNDVNKIQPLAISQYMGALLIIGGIVILLYLVPEIYQFLKNPNQSTFITSVLSNHLKGTFSYVSKTETYNLDITCMTYTLVIILNMIVFAIIAGIAKTLIYSGTRLFDMPNKDFIENLKNQLKR